MKRIIWSIFLVLILATSSSAIDLLDATAPANSALISTYGANSRETRATVNELINAGSTANGANWYNLTEFTDLSTALSTIDTDVKTLLLNRAETLSDDLTIPATLETVCLNGNKLTVPTGKVLTINGPFVCPPTVQAFVLVGTGRVSFGAGAVSEVYAEWFQDNTVPGTTDMTKAVNDAIQAAPVGGTLRGMATSYRLAGTTGTELVLIDKKVHIKGAGTKDTVYVVDENVPNTISVFRWHKAGEYEVRQHTFSDFAIRGAGYFTDPLYPYVINGPAKYGIEIDASGINQYYQYSIIERVKIWPLGVRSVSVACYHDPNACYNMSRMEDNSFTNGILLDYVTDGNVFRHNHFAGPGYGVDITPTPWAFNNDFTDNVFLSGGGIIVRSGLSPIIRNNVFENHYASTDARNAVIALEGNVAKVKSAVIKDNAINSYCADTYGWGGLGADIGILDNNASDTRISGNYFGMCLANATAISTTTLSSRCQVDPSNVGIDVDLFGHYWGLYGWAVHSGDVFKVSSVQEPLAMFRTVVVTQTEMTKASSLAAIADQEWWWAAGVLYVREVGETISGIYIDGIVHTGHFKDMRYIDDNGTSLGLNEGLTLLNSWVAYNNVEPPRVYKDLNGFVRASGVIKDGNYTANVPLFNIPANYRPQISRYITALAYEPTALAAEKGTWTASGTLDGNISRLISGTLQGDNTTVISDTDNATATIAVDNVTITAPASSYMTNVWRPVTLQILCANCTGAGNVVIAETVNGAIAILNLDTIQYKAYESRY